MQRKPYSSPGFGLLDESGICVPSDIAVERAALRHAERLREQEHWQAAAKTTVEPKVPEDPGKQTLLPAWHKKSAVQREHRLYAIDDIEHALRRNEVHGSRDGKIQKQVAALLTRMREIGPYRRLVRVPCRWRSRLTALHDDYPNFTRVIDLIMAEFALAAAIGKPVDLPPLLLDGPPGIGKTTFAHALSTILHCGFLQINMETAQTANALAGADEHWSNAKVGQLFSQLVEGEYASPVVLVDEVDKARVSSNSGHDPASALYSLLECSSAKCWHDLALPAVKLDASKVFWILTANDRHRIAGPLRSRMREFDIPPLTTGQARTVVNRIFAHQARSLRKLKFSPELPDKVAMLLALGSPRDMQRICRELIAKAVLAGRRHVIQQDLNDIPLGDHATSNSHAMVHVSIERVLPAYGSQSVH